jgi:hypothetical protein
METKEKTTIWLALCGVVALISGGISLCNIITPQGTTSDTAERSNAASASPQTPLSNESSENQSDPNDNLIEGIQHSNLSVGNDRQNGPSLKQLSFANPFAPFRVEMTVGGAGDEGRHYISVDTDLEKLNIPTLPGDEIFRQNYYVGDTISKLLENGSSYQLGLHDFEGDGNPDLILAVYNDSNDPPSDLSLYIFRFNLPPPPVSKNELKVYFDLAPKVSSGDDATKLSGPSGPPCLKLIGTITDHAQHVAIIKGKYISCPFVDGSRWVYLYKNGKFELYNKE